MRLPVGLRPAWPLLVRLMRLPPVRLGRLGPLLRPLSVRQVLRVLPLVRQRPKQPGFLQMGLPTLLLGRPHLLPHLLLRSLTRRLVVLLWRLDPPVRLGWPSCRDATICRA